MVYQKWRFQCRQGYKNRKTYRKESLLPQINGKDSESTQKENSKLYDLLVLVLSIERVWSSVNIIVMNKANLNLEEFQLGSMKDGRVSVGL